MKIETFRKLIREEVKRAIREEIPTILHEAIRPTTTQESPKRINSSISDLLEGHTLTGTNTTKSSATTGNPMLDLLNETRMQMVSQNEEWPSVGTFDSSAVNSYRGEMAAAFSGGAPVVQSVDQMLQSSRPSEDINQVQINAVPDFSKLMGALKEKGKL